MSRTRIFISCGQDESRREASTARAVADRLERLGFDVYIAVEQQSLSGITEGIFRVLEQAEYFLFIDFARERIGGGSEQRGSLFSHQELAVAAFLDKEVMAFREDRVRQLDGLAGFLQANAVQFSDRATLPDAVVEAVQRRGWKADWYNGLAIDVNEPPFRDAIVADTQQSGRFFHLVVENRHSSRHADHCVAFLDSVRIESNGLEVPFETVEFKWAGFLHPSTRIVARGRRLLDAFWLWHFEPFVLQYNAFTDSNLFVPRIVGPGSWILRFSVTSSTVRGATREFRLRLGSRLHDISLSAVEAVPHSAT